MRVILICLSLAALSVTFAADKVLTDPEKKIPEYGTKSATTITVKINGEGIKRPGTYHVNAGTTLFALITESGLSDVANGRFTVHRVVDGYERTFGFRMSRTKSPALPDFTLLDDDYIYGAINMP